MPKRGIFNVTNAKQSTVVHRQRNQFQFSSFNWKQWRPLFFSGTPRPKVGAKILTPHKYVCSRDVVFLEEGGPNEWFPKCDDNSHSCFKFAVCRRFSVALGILHKFSHCQTVRNSISIIMITMLMLFANTNCVTLFLGRKIRVKVIIIDKKHQIVEFQNQKP